MVKYINPVNRIRNTKTCSPSRLRASICGSAVHIRNVVTSLEYCATVAQYAKDVTTFLMWTAEPHMEARKRLGLQVFVFLILLAGLLYFTKKKVWANAH